MAVSSTRRIQLKAELVRLNAQLTTIDATISSLLDQEINSYSFNSGEGQQQAKRVDVEKMYKLRERITAQIDSVTRILNNTGVVNVNVRRY